ncbi:MAG TPA: DMT family transporter [Thermoanaerobaculia bacterium]|jgi:drug/metabolite transporter (DMT)-like permease
MTSICDTQTTTTRDLMPDWLLLVAPGVIWGASFLFIAEGLKAIGPAGVTFVRIAIGFATLALFPSAWKPIAREDWRGIILLAVVWLAFPLTMFPFAEERVSSALTGMLNAAIPLFVALVTAVSDRRLPSRAISVGLGVGLAGAILIALPSMGEGESSMIGVMLILAALVAYGFALTIAKPLQQRNGVLPVIWRAQLVAVVLTAPLGIPDVLRASWTPRALLSLLALGALGTAIAHVMITIASGRVGPTRASATTFLIPGVALLLGVVILGESVSPIAVAGCVVCVAGAWLIRRAQLAPLSR